MFGDLGRILLPGDPYEGCRKGLAVRVFRRLTLDWSVGHHVHLTLACLDGAYHAVVIAASRLVCESPPAKQLVD